MKNISRLRKLFLCSEIVVLSGAILGLSGCALGDIQTSVPEPVIGPATPGATLQGKVIGGQNPINGGHVYLFAAGQSAAAHTYGTGATSLLTSAVLTNNTTATDAASNTGIGAKDGSNNYYVATDSSGYFSISSDYSCPGAVNGYSAEVYLLAIGGDAGSGSNTNIALMAALGPCVSASQLAAAVPTVNINEITTVAAVWALQQFMSNPSGTAGSINIGAPTTNLVGLQNAFTMAGNLANLTYGAPIPANTLATPEADHIYTLGDILSYCVNSSTPSSSCSSLFSSVTPSGTTLSTKGIAASTLNAPKDTIQAAWYLAQFPANIGGAGTCGTSAAAFACIQSTGAPFTAMSTSPTDWTLAVGLKPTYNNSGTTTVAIDDPYAVVLDGYGNAWVDSISGTAGLSSVVPIATTGAAIYPPVTSYPVAQNSGYAAYTNSTYSTTAQTTGTTHTISGPRGMTVDSSGNVWLGDYNNKATTGEVAISGGTGLNCSTNCYFGTVAEFPAATGIGAASSMNVAGYYSPYLVWPAAADASGNVYFAFGDSAVGTRTVGVFNSSGTYTQGAGTGTGVYTLAVDNNTSNSNGPNLWIDAMSGCVPTAGGEASIIAQVPTGTITAVSSYYGLIGAGEQSTSPAACTTGVHDAIAALTGEVVGVSFDASNNIWLVNGATQPLAGTAGPTAANNTVTYGVVSKPATGTGVWVNTSGTAYASVASSAGLAGMNNPQYSEVDGSGNLWISNYGAATISEVNVTNVSTSSMAINTLSGASGFQHSETASALSSSEGIGIDLSGNVWVANSAGSAVHYMTVLVGAATPVGPVIPGKYGVAP